MKLIDQDTRKEIKPGDVVTDFRGDKATLVSFTAPHKPSSTGRVCLLEEGQQREYFPGVINAEIVEGE